MIKPSCFFSFALMACVAITSSCSPFSGKKPPVVARGTFSVKVVSRFGKNAKIFIAAYTRNAAGKRQEDVAFNRVGDDGIVNFVQPAGEVYEVEAYADFDGKGRRSDVNPKATLTGLKPVADLNAKIEPYVLTLPDKAPAPAPAADAATAAGAKGKKGPGNKGAGAATKGAGAPAAGADAAPVRKSGPIVVPGLQ